MSFVPDIGFIKRLNGKKEFLALATRLNQKIKMRCLIGLNMRQNNKHLEESREEYFYYFRVENYFFNMKQKALNIKNISKLGFTNIKALIHQRHH